MGEVPVAYIRHRAAPAIKDQLPYIRAFFGLVETRGRHLGSTITRAGGSRSAEVSRAVRTTAACNSGASRSLRGSDGPP